MYLLAKFGDHAPDKNGDINPYIKSYTDILENAELTTSIHQIAKFLKSGIPIYNSKVPDMAGRKARKRRTQTIAKHFEFLSIAAKRKQNELFLLFKKMKYSQQLLQMQGV